MNSRSLFLSVGLLCAVSLGVCWVRARQQTSAIVAERVAIESVTTELERRKADLSREIATSEANVVRAREAASASLSPAQRTRAAVSPLIARLKESHAVNPPPARRAPPPIPPHSMFFPELLTDAEYSRNHAIVVRHREIRQHRPLLRKLGIEEKTIDQILDLLMERTLLIHDTQSMSPSGGMNPSVAGEVMKVRNELADKIRILMGDERYDRFTEDITEMHVSADESGRPVAKRIVTRGIPSSRRPPVTEFRLDELSRRLSYAPEPLGEAQRNALGEWLRASGTTHEIARDLWTNEAFQQLARSTPSPRQFGALDELKAEAEALERRSKLPKTETTPHRGRTSG